MDNTVRLVANRWYHLYFWVMLVFSVAVVGGYTATHIADSLQKWQNTFALGETILALAAIHIIYSVSFYWLIRVKRQPLAMAIGSMLLALMLLYGMSHASGIGAWSYAGVWLITVLFGGMYGSALAFGAFLLISVFVMLQTDLVLANLTPVYWTVLFGSITAIILSYLFWRTQFVNPADKQVSQLSGMLRSKQEQSSILLSSLTDGVIVMDTTFKISLINPAAATMTGWAVGDAQGVDAHLVAKFNQQNGQEIASENNPLTIAIQQKRPQSQTLELESHDGKRRMVSLAISPVVVNGGMTGAVAVIRDISQQYAAEQQRAEFISTASHEMRTPVAAIEGYLELALNPKVSTIDSRAKNYLDKARTSTRHLGKLFQDLLTSAKAEDGRLSSHQVVVEMGNFMEQLVEDLKLTAQKKGLITEFIVGETQTIDATGVESSLKVVKPLYYVYADPDRLREVLTNLFDNAVKYTEQGKISLGLTGDNDVVQVYVRDTGQGIPADDIPHLFQKFYRVDSSATRMVGGTGLGLFIARKIIELYRGRIWAESELGKGSTFYINLPRLTTRRAEQLQSAQSALQNSPPQK